MEHPCDWVATTVVSEMNERLSPKNEPPTTMPVSIGTESPVAPAMPTAIGVSATMVPTLVPMLSDISDEARNSPASRVSAGTMARVRLTNESTHPIFSAELAKAPANTNIQSMVMRFLRPAPRLNFRMRLLKCPFETAIANIAVSMNATVIGTL